MRELDNSLRRQSYSLPGMLKELFEPLWRQSKDLAKEYGTAIDQVIVTGCGDSHAAAMAMRFSFWELTGIPCEVVPVIDLSRCYPMERLTASTLVVIISVSGNGARIEEALEKVKRAGALTLAVTKNRDSGIGRGAGRILQMDISAFEQGPGNRNYFASLLALFLYSLAMGRSNGHLTVTQADAYEAEILNLGMELEALLPEMDKQILEISRKWEDFINFDFVGAGNDFVNAWIGHAKVIEAIGAFATYNNSEEWFHMNNFYRNIRSCGTLIFASKDSPGIGRTREAVRYAARIGRPVMVITDEKPSFFAVESEHVFYVPVPSAVYQPFTMLTHYLPACLLAGYIGAAKGEHNCRGCLGPWEFAAGGAYIRDSEIILPEG